MSRKKNPEITLKGERFFFKKNEPLATFRMKYRSRGLNPFKMTLEKMLTARYESLLFQQFENNIRCVEIYVARGRVFLDFL